MTAITQQKRRSADDMLGSIDDIEPTRATSNDLAAFWSVTAKQVSKLVEEAVIQKGDSQKTATQKYIRHLIKTANHPSHPKMAAEKLRLAKEQADRLEIANAESRRELVSAKSVESAWATILRDVRAGMLAVPGRLQSKLPHLTAHDVRTVEDEIKSALKELADGND